MTTGPIGGSWYTIGAAMIEVIGSATGERYTQTPAGGVSNLFNVGSGKAALGLTTAGAAASAVNGTYDFEGRAQEDVRLLGALYPQQYTLVVWADSGSETVADLEGKSVQTRQRGSSTELMTRRVLGAHGLSYDDLSVSFGNLSAGANQMKDGQIDAMSHLITHRSRTLKTSPRRGRSTSSPSISPPSRR